MTKSAARPSSANGLTVYSGSVAGLAWKETRSLARSSLTQRVREPVDGTERRRRHPVRRELSLRREQEVDERGCDRAEDREQRPFEPATDPGEVDQDDGEHDGGGLRQDVPATDVRELVRDHGLELGGRQRTEQAGGERDRRAGRPAPRGERARIPVGNQVELRRHDAELGRERIHRRAQQRVLGERVLPGAEHPEERSIGIRVHGERGEQGAEHEHGRRLRPAERPAQRAEEPGQDRDHQPPLGDVQSGCEPHGLGVVVAEAVAVVVAEAAGWPVRLRCVAAARAVQRRDVLERHENVAVQLDVGDVLDRAVGGENTFLILAAEEGDFDLLALYLFV